MLRRINSDYQTAALRVAYFIVYVIFSKQLWFFEKEEFFFKQDFACLVRHLLLVFSKQRMSA